jgi:hypothetical protein
MAKKVSIYKLLVELIEEAIYIHQVKNVDDCIKYMTTVSHLRHLDKNEITKLMDRVMLGTSDKFRKPNKSRA